VIVTAAAAAVVVMAVVEKEKLQEESVIRRFYQIILSWDYFALLKESKANSLLSLTLFPFLVPLFFAFNNKSFKFDAFRS